MTQLNVLLVDDEAEFVTTLAERLELRGVDVSVATDCEEAIRLVESVRPQVVVADVKMPGMGGLDLLRFVKARHPGVEVILLTGHGSTQDGIKGMRLGAFDYLMKPVKIEDLIEKLKTASAVRRDQQGPSVKSER
jgi:DNA-binding NtrC family response regulator